MPRRAYVLFGNREPLGFGVMNADQLIFHREKTLSPRCHKIYKEMSGLQSNQPQINADERRLIVLKKGGWR